MGIELTQQQEDQATAYLQSIGREARVSASYVERRRPDIDVPTSNKLFANSPQLSEFPSWLGTRETVENGTRYIYETTQSKTSDGYDLISFRKIKSDGTVVQEYQYKIEGGYPRLIE